MTLIPFEKTAKTYNEQLQKLKARGLKISDEAKALHLLEKLSYYRLSGYWYPMLKIPKSDHVFKEGANFQTAFKLYRFDRDLRIFILKELEKIEVAIRAQMIYQLSHSKGSFWMSEIFNFKDTRIHSQTVLNLKKDYAKSDEEFIKSYKLKYQEELPPCWMLLEISSFGTLSKIYGNLKSGKRDIANSFGLDDKTFASWIHCFVYIRNVCAHHSRLWNRAMSIKPAKPLTPDKIWLSNTDVSNNKTYFILSMMLYLLQSIDIKHQFIYRLKVLLKKYPNIDAAAMGFPAKWEEEKLWKFDPTLKQRLFLIFASKVK